MFLLNSTSTVLKIQSFCLERDRAIMARKVEYNYNWEVPGTSSRESLKM